MPLNPTHWTCQLLELFCHPDFVFCRVLLHMFDLEELFWGVVLIGILGLNVFV